MSEPMTDPQSHPEPELTPPQPVVPGPFVPPPTTPRRAYPAKPLLIFGIGLIFIGILAALDNLGIADMHVVLKLWPLILVFMGIAKIRQQDGSNGGYALLIGGLFALMVVFGHRHVEDVIGPMILVAVGIFVILKSLNKHRGLSPEQRLSENMVSGSAIFSGFKRRITSRTFQGGELTSIFGGFDLDLRQAAIPEGSAQIDVFVMFGGGELRVPEDWRVDVQTTAIFGGVEDKTHSFREAPREDQPRLVITGMVLFGGLEVSH